jgi:hypothetical protein
MQFCLIDVLKAKFRSKGAWWQKCRLQGVLMQKFLLRDV